MTGTEGADEGQGSGEELVQANGSDLEPAPGAAVDKSRALTLTGREASALMSRLGGTAQLGRRARSELFVGDVYELVPSAELAKGIRDGTLRMANSKKGDASPLVKQVKNGQIAGHAKLNKVRQSMSLKVVGNVAFAAVSYVVQEQQMAEISERLRQVEQTADEGRKLTLGNRAAEGDTARQLAAHAHAMFESLGRVPEHIISELRDARRETQTALNAQLRTVRDHLDLFKAGKMKTAEAEKMLKEDFTHLADLMDAFAEANTALASIPYADPQQRTDSIEDAGRRLAEMSGLVQQLVIEALRLGGESKEKVDAFTERLQEDWWGRVAPKWMRSWTLWEAPKGVDSLEGLFKVGRWRIPDKEMSEPMMRYLRKLMGKDENAAAVPLLVEVIEDGTVLIGPAAAQQNEPS